MLLGLRIFDILLTEDSLQPTLIATVLTLLEKDSPESIVVPRILISLENSTDVPSIFRHEFIGTLLFVIHAACVFSAARVICHFLHQPLTFFKAQFTL